MAKDQAGCNTDRGKATILNERLRGQVMEQKEGEILRERSVDAGP